MFTLSARKLFLALLSGLLLTASFPSANHQWIAWFSLVPLLIAIKDESSSNAFKLGLAAGLGHYITLIYWIINVISTYGELDIITSTFLLILLCLYLSIYPAFFSLLVTTFSKSKIKIFLFSGFWVSLEYIKAKILTGFPWCLLGYSQFNQKPIIQIADVTGVYGVSFIITGVNILIYLLISNFKQNIKSIYTDLEALFLIIIICLSINYGNYCIETYSKGSKKNGNFNISIIQGNINQAVKWDPEYQGKTIKKYHSLTKKTFDYKPDLIIWPETSVPFFFQDKNNYSRIIYNISKNSQASFIFGSPSYIRRGNEIDYYNSAFCVSPDGNITGQYNKTHLVPFGEYVPLKKLLPFVYRLVPAAGDFSPGESLDPMELGKTSSGILICYEVIFPEISRELVQKGARVLINITNDAWFGHTSAPYQHLYMSIFRSIENRVPLIRSANTGFSGIISSTGEIKTAGELFTEESITGKITLNKTPLSFYSRYGDIFALGILIICLIKIFFELCYRRFAQTKRRD